MSVSKLICQFAMVKKQRDIKYIRYHGNWGGPNWTAGQVKPTAELTDADRLVPAVDAFDQVCKDHDIGLHDATTPEQVQAVNSKFIKEAAAQGFKGTAAAILVALGGPSQPNLPANDKMSPGRTTKRLRRTPEILESYEDVTDSVHVDEVSSTFGELARQSEEDADIVEFVSDAYGGNLRGSPARPVPNVSLPGIDPPGRPRSSFDNSRQTPNDGRTWNERWRAQNDDDTVMDSMDTGDDTQSAMAMEAQSGSNGGQNNTTQIVRGLKPRFPWHHVEEAVHEHHACCSVNFLTQTSETKNYLKIRMNTPIFPYSEMPNSAVQQTSLAQPEQGISNSTVGRYFVGNGVYHDITFNRNIQTFNTPLFANPAVTPYTLQVPGGLDYFQRHYSAYTVTKCEWTMLVTMPYHAYTNTGAVTGNGIGGDPYVIAVTGASTHSAMTEAPCDVAGRLFMHYTSVGQSVTPVNPPLTATTQEMERWNSGHLNKVTLPVNGTRVLRGTWTPQTVEHNALNDKDIDVWTAVGSVPTNSHLEHLIIQFKEKANNNSIAGIRIGCNVKINLKYYVQYREPKTEIQYPLSAQTNPTGTAINSRLLQVAPAHNT